MLLLLLLSLSLPLSLRVSPACPAACLYQLLSAALFPRSSFRWCIALAPFQPPFRVLLYVTQSRER